jgi:hypothetical protein
MKQKEEDLKIIADANKGLFHAAAAAQEEMTTEPDRKPTIDVSDELKPALNVGNYVKVNADTSFNKNRPEGFGFVQDVRGVGAATIVNVKYDSHSIMVVYTIPFRTIESLLLCMDKTLTEGKRKEQESALNSRRRQLSCRRGQLSSFSKTCSPVDEGSISKSKERMAPRSVGFEYWQASHLHRKKNELLTHVMLLEEYIARSGATASRKAKHKINYKRSRKFAKQKSAA